MASSPPPPARGAGARAVLAALALALIVAAVGHVRGAGEHPNNQDRELDLLLARRVAAQGVLTDGSRSPLFPVLLAPFAGDDPGFAQRARWVALLLGGLAFGATFLLLRTMLPERVAVLATLLAGPEWTFQVSRVRPEPLVAFLLVAFAAALVRSATSSRPLRLVAVAGVAAGLAHLGKGSGLLTVAAAVGLLAWPGALGRRVGGEVASGGEPPRAPARPSWAAVGGSLGVFLGAFLVTVAPLLVANLRQFGAPFHNANVAHVMWEVAGEDQQWRFSTATLGSWWAAHGAGGSFARLVDGCARVTHGPLLYALLVAAAIAVAVRRRVVSGGTAAFVLVAVALTLTWLPPFAWYVPIANGRRYLFPVVAVALPALVAVLDAGLVHLAPRLVERASRAAAAVVRVGGHPAVIVAAALALGIVEMREAAHPPAVGPRVPFDAATLATAARLRALPPGTRILAGPAATVPSPWLVSDRRDYVHLPPEVSPADAATWIRAHADVVLLSDNLRTRRGAVFGAWARPDATRGGLVPAHVPPWVAPLAGAPTTGPHLLFAVRR